MNPNALLRLRTGHTAPQDALEFAEARLWRAIGIEPETPRGRAIADTLLAPARSMLERGGKRFRGQLVDLSWRLGGGPTGCPDALSAVIEMIHAGSLIVDDIEDGSTERRGAPTVHRLFGMPLALNAGNWLYFWSLELLCELQLPAAVELDLHRRIGRMLVRGHAGQSLDIGGDVARIDQHEMPAHVADMSRLKTGSFMGLAAAVGAVAAQAPDELTAGVERFGLALGDALQMLDDLGNLVGAKEPAKRHEDLVCGRATWPWAWFAEVASPAEWRLAQVRLAALRGGTEAPTGLARLLIERVGLLGRQRVRTTLHDAFNDLKQVTGPNPLLAGFRSEMMRLEKSYV
jgi:geranylgeranyl pyrophosphate synthase